MTSASPATREPFLTQQTIEFLGRAIVSGQIAEGSILDRKALPQSLDGISRTVLREATSALTSLGLVQPVKRRGTVVLGQDRWAVLHPRVIGWMIDVGSHAWVLDQVHRFREIIEPAAAHAAARFRTPEHLAQLESALAALEVLVQGGSDNVDVDVRFHLALIEAAGNRLFCELRPSVEHALRASLGLKLGHDSLARRDKALGLHRAVVAAVAAQDPVAAQQAMMALLSYTYIETATLQSDRPDPPLPAS